MPDHEVSRFKSVITLDNPDEKSRQSSWERIWCNTCLCNMHFASYVTPAIALGLVSEIALPKLIEGTSEGALQIIPEIYLAGFLGSFVISGTAELARTQGSRLVQGVMARTKRFREDNFTFVPQIPEFSPNNSRLGDSLSWNSL